MRNFPCRSILWTMAIAFPWLVAGGALGVMTRPNQASTTIGRLDNLGLAKLSPTIVAEIPQIRPQKINPMAKIAAQMQQAEAQAQRGKLSEAEALYQKALTAAEQEGHGALQATLHNYLGHLAQQQNQPQQAKQSFQLALELGQGDHYVTSNALMGLAEIAFQAGDLKVAKSLYDRTLPQARNIGDRTLVAQIETRLQTVNKALKPAPAKQTIAAKPQLKLPATPKPTQPTTISQTVPPVQMVSNPQN
ncbi:MAG: tetratricopeptide repeat protein [Alkalinema sp. RU_4_3]|nr:tetratricopeptide repeat protein [Alkalinema sp. RU_4_3]